MAVVFPYEDFPLIGQMNFDTGESFYKKVFFLNSEVIFLLTVASVNEKLFPTGFFA